MAISDDRAIERDARIGAGIHQRQVLLTVAILLLALWVALEFLTPIAWATVLAIAEWPLFRRALARFPDRPGLLAFGFTLATALLVIMPLSLAAVTLAQESDTALAWLNHAQQTGIPTPAWLPCIPLVGGRLASYWQEHAGNPQAAHALLGTVSAASVIGWTRSICAEVARESALFLVTLLALVSLLARGAADRGEGAGDRGRHVRAVRRRVHGADHRCCPRHRQRHHLGIGGRGRDHRRRLCGRGRAPAAAVRDLHDRAGAGAVRRLGGIRGSPA